MPVRCHFDAADDFERIARGLASRLDARQRIMVGDCESDQPAAPRQLDELGRRVSAIAARRMQVQIGAPCVARTAELTTELSEWCAGRHGLRGNGPLLLEPVE